MLLETMLKNADRLFKLTSGSNVGTEGVGSVAALTVPMLSMLEQREQLRELTREIATVLLPQT